MDGRSTEPDRDEATPGERGGRLVPVMLQRAPDNLEPPFSALDGFLTPVDRFYVRSHFEVPQIDPAAWRLSVEGRVERPFQIGLDELRRMPARTQAALLECSGNGRIFLETTQVGIRWGLGGVGNAEWTGVPLAELLNRAGVRPGAVEVILEGADAGEHGPPRHETPGRIAYARSLPLARAMSPEVILAFGMNGEDLPAPHGRPVRAIVPGWYGMASVKWLRRIVVVDRPFHGFFQTMEYAVWQRRDGLATLEPVSEVRVKAQIARPAPREIVPRGTTYRVFGAAWAGAAMVERVEFSGDGGESWKSARLLGEPVRYAWRLWECEWDVPPEPGRRVVMARATDDAGRSQASERDPDLRDAVISHVLPIEIEVR